MLSEGCLSTGKKQTVKSGYHTTLKFQVMKIVPSKDLAIIEPKKRGCRLETETQNLKLFKVYSQLGCRLEIQMSYAKTYCKCIPWYLPSEGTGRHTICDQKLFLITHFFDKSLHRQSKGNES